MARAIGQGYKILGLTSCPACGKEIPAKETKGGQLSIACTWCDLSLYVRPGTRAHELLFAKVKLEAPALAPQPGVTPRDAVQPGVTSPAPEKKDPAPPARRFTGPLFGGS